MKKIYWRRLDNQAKIFSLASGRRYASIFRLSVVLKENIDKDILEEAVSLALLKYDIFKVKVRRGLFWHYLDRNKKKPIVILEEDYPFQKVNTRENNNYLFRVSYFKNKINIEFYHILTDGNGGLEFFKEIIYQYIEIKHFHNRLESSYFKCNDLLTPYHELSSNSISNTRVKNPYFAYSLKGDVYKKGVISVHHISVPVSDIKDIAKKYGVTIGVYISSVICYAIYKKNYVKYESNDIIRLSVPVNLKKYFDVHTNFNCFSHIDIDIGLKKDVDYSFADILSIVDEEFKCKLDKDFLYKIVYNEEKILNNFFVRIIPLFLKVFMVKSGSFLMKRHFTTSISNMGEVVVLDKYKKYINEFMVMLSPDWAEKVKFGICSYNNKLVISIDSYLISNDIEKEIYHLLKEEELNVMTEGNGVKSVISKKNKKKRKKTKF